MPKTVNYQIDEGGNVGAPPTTTSNIDEAFNFITEFNENAQLFGQLMEAIAQVDANALVAGLIALGNTSEIGHLKGAFARLTDQVHSLTELGRAEEAWKNDPRRKATNPSGQGPDILID